jgi:hypothetical protein
LEKQVLTIFIFFGESLDLQRLQKVTGNIGSVGGNRDHGVLLIILENKNW